MTAFRSVDEAKTFVRSMSLLYGGIDRALDAALKKTEENGRKPTCSKGCDHCCHILMFATVPEAIFTLAVAEQEGLDVEAMKPAILDQTADSLMPDMSLTKWFTEKRRPCALLQADGSCGVYKARPTSCRVYYVVSDPSACAFDHATGEVSALNTLGLLVPAVQTLDNIAKALGLVSVGLGTWAMNLRAALAFREGGMEAANAAMMAMRMDDLEKAHARLHQIKHGKPQIVRLPEEKRHPLIIASSALKHRPQ